MASGHFVAGGTEILTPLEILEDIRDLHRFDLSKNAGKDDRGFSTSMNSEENKENFV